MKYPLKEYRQKGNAEKPKKSKHIRPAQRAKLLEDYNSFMTENIFRVPSKSIYHLLDLQLHSISNTTMQILSNVSFRSVFAALFSAVIVAMLLLLYPVIMFGVFYSQNILIHGCRESDAGRDGL